MVFLDSDDVADLVSFGDAIDLVEDAYRQLGTGRATDVPRTNVSAPGTDGSLKSLVGTGPSGLGGNLYTGFRGPRGASKLVALFDETTGELRCAIEGDRLSWLRTGATGGVAVDHCARDDATTLGVIGSGRQARAQLFAVDRVRELEDVAVYSPTAANRSAFAEAVADEINADVPPVSSTRAAVEGETSSVPRRRRQIPSSTVRGSPGDARHGHRIPLPRRTRDRRSDRRTGSRDR
jgi:alanine dehydrogenase